MISFVNKSIAALRVCDGSLQQHRGAPSPRLEDADFDKSIAALRGRDHEEVVPQEHRDALSSRPAVLVESIAALRGRDTCMMSYESIAALGARDHSPSGTGASRRFEFATVKDLSHWCGRGAP